MSLQSGGKGRTAEQVHMHIPLQVGINALELEQWMKESWRATNTDEIFSVRTHLG